MNRRSFYFSMTILLLLLILFSFFFQDAAQAAINGYLGNGYFSTNNLKWCHSGSGYSAQSQNAVNRWSVDTDLNMSTNCTGTQVYTVYASYGNTGWAGYAYICNTSNVCNNSTAWASTYKSCEARLNATAITGNPSFYTNAEVQKLATHELGHCYSLDHANTSGSVMASGSVPNSQDINLINARY